jgi:hypothetical protein
VIGESLPSNYKTIALAHRAARPAAPTVDYAKSSLTSLFVKWNPVTGDIETEGYILTMLEMSTGIVTIVYDGSLNPLITAYNVGGLTTGSQYAFYVQSLDFNGVSLSSDESVFVVC